MNAARTLQTAGIPALRPSNAPVRGTFGAVQVKSQPWDPPFQRARRPSSPARPLLLRFAAHRAAWGFLAILAFGLPKAHADVAEVWVHRYSNVVSNSDDRSTQVVCDAAGDIIVTGTAKGGISGQDMLTIKHSGKDGTVLWQRRYNGTWNVDDVVKAMAVDGDGNVVITGYSDPGWGPTNAYTAKYAAADGRLLWENRHGNGTELDSEAFVAMDPGGNVVVTEKSPDNGGFSDSYTAKYAAADGTLLWERWIARQTGHHNYPVAMAMDGSGNVVLMGRSYRGPNFVEDYIVKFSGLDGSLLWEKRSGGQRQAMTVDASGNVGVIENFHGANGPGYYTAKYAASDGALLWEKRFDGPVGGIFGVEAVGSDRSGNVTVSGFSIPLDEGEPSGFFTVKFAAVDGALLWEQFRADPVSRWPRSPGKPMVAMDGGGDVIVTMVLSAGPLLLNDDYYTAKYAGTNGALLWEQRYDGPANGNDEARSVVMDASGNVFVTGESDGGASRADFYTAKYAAADGALLWGQRYNASTPNYAFPRAVAMDASGNVAVTGTAYNESDHGALSEGDYYTAKHAATDGALLWTRRYDGPADGEDWAEALALDSSGNVFVTGFSLYGSNIAYTAKYAALDGALLWEKHSDGGGQAMAVDGSGNVVVTGISLNGNTTDYYTAKYAATDGALLWEHRYNGPATGNDEAVAVALDRSGNVAVTGRSASASVTNRGSIHSLHDYYTAKYAATDGTLLWEKRYNGPANSDDQATAMVIDGHGNVVVTGKSAGSAAVTNEHGFFHVTYDYCTAKYAAEDGALLWEKRYNGPANGDDVVHAVAADGAGNIVVTGRSVSSSATNAGGFINIVYHVYTAKYAAADGALLWEKRDNGPAYEYGGASSVAVNDRDDVVVAMTSGDTNGNHDYYTAKYSGVDGTLLWEKRYDGPAHGDDVVVASRSLALGPNGMVAITGSSSGAIATVVYREVLPAVTIDLVPAGVRLRFTHDSGSPRRIERAPAITGPWNTLATPPAPASGVIEYVDIDVRLGPTFYRTAQP